MRITPRLTLHIRSTYEASFDSPRVRAPGQGVRMITSPTTVTPSPSYSYVRVRINFLILVLKRSGKKPTYLRSTEVLLLCYYTLAWLSVRYIVLIFLLDTLTTVAVYMSTLGCHSDRRGPCKIDHRARQVDCSPGASHRLTRAPQCLEYEHYCRQFRPFGSSANRI